MNEGEKAFLAFFSRRVREKAGRHFRGVNYLGPLKALWAFVCRKIWNTRRKFQNCSVSSIVINVGENKNQNKIYLDDIIFSHVFFTNVESVLHFFLKKTLLFRSKKSGRERGSPSQLQLGTRLLWRHLDRGAGEREERDPLDTLEEEGFSIFFFSFSSFESMGKGKEISLEVNWKLIFNSRRRRRRRTVRNSPGLRSMGINK